MTGAYSPKAGDRIRVTNTLEGYVKAVTDRGVIEIGLDQDDPLVDAYIYPNAHVRPWIATIEKIEGADLE
ncbi:hypothetical protein ACFV9C_42600 [Kribbella sp. NPDC059898]|uniref:hypothetical protein n=1 Tax=Kribbella sp. NPDC059898 TaxID=3346995 RepID=UPI00364F2DDD